MGSHFSGWGSRVRYRAFGLLGQRFVSHTLLREYLLLSRTRQARCSAQRSNTRRLDAPERGPVFRAVEDRTMVLDKRNLPIVVVHLDPQDSGQLDKTRAVADPLFFGLATYRTVVQGHC